MNHGMIEAVDKLLATSLLSTDASARSTTLRAGVDAVDITVLSRQLDGPIGQKFRDRVFTADEIRDSRDEARKLATRWAIKEAVSKAIGTGFRRGLRPSHIEVVTAPDGSVTVKAAPSAPPWPDGAVDWQWAVSATHESGIAIAIALAVTSAT